MYLVPHEYGVGPTSAPHGMNIGWFFQFMSTTGLLQLKGKIVIDCGKFNVQDVSQRQRRGAIIIIVDIDNKALTHVDKQLVELDVLPTFFLITIPLGGIGYWN